MPLVTCPFCGEPVEIDSEVEEESATPGWRTFVQDCDVCCNPISVRIRVGVRGDVETDYDRE